MRSPCSNRSEMRSGWCCIVASMVGLPSDVGASSPWMASLPPLGYGRNRTYGQGVKMAAIAGLGLTEGGKGFGRTSFEFAAEAVDLAARDAGPSPGDLRGRLSHPPLPPPALDLPLSP